MTLFGIESPFLLKSAMKSKPVGSRQPVFDDKYKGKSVFLVSTACFCKNIPSIPTKTTFRCTCQQILAVETHTAYFSLYLSAKTMRSIPEKVTFQCAC